MKTIWIGAAWLLMGIFSAQAQNEYVIEGRVEGLKDGTVMRLLRWEGRVGSVVAFDTVRNETFRFEGQVSAGKLDKLSVNCRAEDFPHTSLPVYVTPGAKISITGTNHLLKTWKVDSPVKEQQEWNRYTEAAKDLWDEYQRLMIKENPWVALRRSATSTEAEKERARAEERVLNEAKDVLDIKICEREIPLMKEAPVSAVWLDKLYGMSVGVRYDPDFPYTKEVVALYDRLSAEQKASSEGKNIAANLFPPVVVKEGDAAPDADLYDLEGRVHHLADFKGRHILLDFWSLGCGPCIMSLPELKEIHEQYGDRLAVVSISSDTEKRWRKASAVHQMAWMNLSDLKQTAGLYAKYGINGIPYYVLISPEGKVMKKWSGYGKGSLKEEMRKWLGE